MSYDNPIYLLGTLHGDDLARAIADLDRATLEQLATDSVPWAAAYRPDPWPERDFYDE